MIALIDQIPSEAQIKKHLRNIIFGKNLFCPVCGSRKIYSSESRYRCRKCRKPFSVFSGTWLKDMKLSLRTFGRCSGVLRKRFRYSKPKNCAICPKRRSGAGFANSASICPNSSPFFRNGPNGRGVLSQPIARYG